MAFVNLLCIVFALLLLQLLLLELSSILQPDRERVIVLLVRKGLAIIIIGKHITVNIFHPFRLFVFGNSVRKHTLLVKCLSKVVLQRFGKICWKCVHLLRTSKHVAEVNRNLKCPSPNSET